jgi:vacuolar-type H+-ATPase subunit I/STV1
MSSKLISRLTNFVSTQTTEPSKKELTEAVKEVYKEKSKKEKSENAGKEKKKREPSLYNIYYKTKAAEIKEREKSLPKEERMTAKAMMSYIANLWQEEKNIETFQDANDDILSDSEVEPVAHVKSSKGKKKGT